MMRFVCFAFLAWGPGASLAQARPTGNAWEPMAHITSADLAVQGWSVTEAAGLALSHGQSAVVTYWELNRYNTLRVVRCVASFDASLNQTGEVCPQSMGNTEPS